MMEADALSAEALDRDSTAGRGTEEPGDGEAASGMIYLRSYAAPFESPRWQLNLLLLCVCSWIPMVGHIVLLGYQFTIVGARLRDPEAAYPDFDFGEFVTYLKRGIWPFLASLIAGLIVTPFMMVLSGAMVALMIVGTQMEGEQQLFVLGGGLAAWGLALIACILLMYLVMMPVMLRAGLREQLGAAFRPSAIRDFLRRVWVETLIAGMFLTVSGTILMVAGLACFYFGIYIVTPFLTFVQADLMAQLARLYTSRGGEPLLPAEATVAVVMEGERPGPGGPPPLPT